MGATVYLRWPGLGIDDPIDHPGFSNDDTGYARWIERVTSDGPTAAALREEGFGSLLHVFPADYSDNRIEWVEPQKLKADATRLATEVENQTELGRRMAAMYKAAGGESASELLAQDLRDASDIADFAIDEGVTRVAFTVGW